VYYILLDGKRMLYKRPSLRLIRQDWRRLAADPPTGRLELWSSNKPAPLAFSLHVGELEQPTKITR